MRKQDKFILWPTYFDSAKTRRQGRRVSKSLAVLSPKISELKEAADKLGLICVLNAEVAFPSTPWSKSGMILLQKMQSKEATVREMAKQLLKVRSASSNQVREA
ncbi:MAG TPA: signal recognition particle subunit SRP19/SEC65 family protein [Candidatus Acidoferrum sp.]|nr:signal recognition particle subunit SRP19/SEC65 family protein [Candidatus Acidoferrum sp.]